MCQRVMIAMALACTPSLLIADEPTTGLDVTTQAVIMDLIRDMSRSARMSTLLITHDLGLAGEYCDRIAVMHAGHLVEIAADREAARSSGPSLYAPTSGRHAGRRNAASTSLISIPGQLPDLRSALPPCRFSARCERQAADLRRRPAALDRTVADACRALQVSPVMAPLLEASVADQILSRQGSGARRQAARGR